ncbi:hypothetical protein F5Y17DRAFT_22058 [Xylariaceae sp. FL0594]|nr:hypothetical protein F5Y17DRAFT_22058 [Xylariaceae sp. FL0594]
MMEGKWYGLPKFPGSRKGVLFILSFSLQTCANYKTPCLPLLMRQQKADLQPRRYFQEPHEIGLPPSLLSLSYGRLRFLPLNPYLFGGRTIATLVYA